MSDAHDIGLRYYFAKVHLDTARLFACECRTIERSHDRADSQQVLTRYQSFAIGAIFGAVAGLEAGINELFVDAVEWHEEARRKQPAPNLGGVLRGLETRVVSKLAKAWKMQKKRPDGKVRHSSTPRVVNKCNEALRAAARQEISCAESEDVRLVIRLRNSLVHPKPKTEWLETGTASRRGERIFAELEGRFPPSPFFDDTSNPFFPLKCLGHGCASWALNSIESFLREFHRRMGTTPSYLT